MLVFFSCILIVMGLVFCSLDIFLPVQLYLGMYSLFLSLKYLGFGFGLIGVGLLIGRIGITGANWIIDLPAKLRVNLLHSRSGHNPNAEFLKGRLIDLDFIRTKRKLFKDTGGGTRVCGHDLRFTHEMVNFDIPLWLGDYLHKLKEKYLIKNKKDLLKLLKSLEGLKPFEPDYEIDNDENLETYYKERDIFLRKQLKEIPELIDIKDDESKLDELVGMGISQLKRLEECVLDGKVVHIEDVHDFIDAAPPTELDTLNANETTNVLMRVKNYNIKGRGEFNPNTIIVIGIFIVCVAFAFMILK